MVHMDTQTSTLLLPSSRRDRIVEELDRLGTVRSDDLARRFEVSPETIRRDLLRLEELGVARRIFGGATRSAGRAVEPPFEERRVANLAPKQAMARVAAGLVCDGDTLIFDVGTSVAEVARALPAGLRGRALTNSLQSATELATRPGLEVLLSGGRLREGDLALSGPETVRFFEDYYADRVFLGSGGVDVAAGLTDYHLDEIAVRRVLLRHSTERFVLADSTKIGHVAVGRVCPLEAITAVVTDELADPAAVGALRAAGVEVLVAPLIAPAPSGRSTVAPERSDSHE